MQRPSITTVAAGSLAALAFLLAAAPARAQTSVHISVGMPAVVAQPAPVVVQPAPVRHAHPVHAVPVQVPVQPAYAPGRGYQPVTPVAYGTPRWDPRVRYMPGQVVQRRGALWVAKPVSARVWNENSPPELTPRYWARAAYR